MPDIRLDDQLVVRPHPLLEPIVLEPFVGMRLEQVGDERIASVDDLRRLSQRGLLELWFRRPGSNEEPTLVSWAFTRQVPDLELSATLAISASTDASESVGLEPGDRVLSINDQPLESPGDYLPAMHRFVDSPRRLSVFRERTASRFELVVQVQDRWVAWAIYGAGVAFGLIGFVAYRLRPVSRSALAFLLFATTCSFLWLFRSIPFDNRLLVERHLVTILRLALPAASTILLLSFTPLRRIITRHRLAIGCATLVGVTLGVWNLTSYRGFALEGALALAPGRVLLGFTLGLIVLGVSSDWLSSLFGRRLLPIDRQRARVLRWATLLSLLPLTLYFLFHFDLQLWCELAVILFPLILAYATVRQNLFQINELLLEGLVYGGLLAGLSLTYASVVAGVVPLATAAFGGGESLVTFGLVAGTTLIALPVHTQLRLRLKRRFESSDLNAEALIGSETGSTITVGSPVELCREMASRIAAFLGTNSVRVFFRSPETDDWMAADSVASPPSGPLIEACRPLLNVIAERGEDVVRDVMDDDLLATEHERSIVNAMHALGASLAIPLTVSGDVWGVLAVGDKNTATNYTVGEIRSLRRLARELALGLYRAHVAFGVGSPPRRGVPLSNLFPRPPERISPYDVERLLGEGGMALVYLATRDGRQVAVKVLNDRARQSLKLERRFQRECEILREIHHPNVLGVIDFSPRPEPYLVLEYCPLGTVPRPVAARESTRRCRGASDRTTGRAGSSRGT